MDAGDSVPADGGRVEYCANCVCPSCGAGTAQCAAGRAAMVSEYLRQALPPVLMLPTSGARLPAVPYGELTTRRATGAAGSL